MREGYLSRIPAGRIGRGISENVWPACGEYSTGLSGRKRNVGLPGERAREGI